MPLALNTQKMMLIGTDSFSRKIDYNLRSLKIKQIEDMKDKPPVLSKLLTLFFRGVYHAFLGLEYTIKLLLAFLKRELHYLAYGDEK